MFEDDEPIPKRRRREVRSSTIPEPEVNPSEPGAPPVRPRRRSSITFETLPVPTEETDHLALAGAADDDLLDEEAESDAVPMPAPEEEPLTSPEGPAPAPVSAPDTAPWVMAGAVIGLVLVIAAMLLT